MRPKLLALAAGAMALSLAGPSLAGPAGSGSGPITVDSTTFVAGQSVMGTDGGVYSDTLPPIQSTTTAAFRMTAYRAVHANLRDASGAAFGVNGNPLYTTGAVTVNISTVQVVNSTVSVTGSTVSVSGTVPVSIVSPNPLTVISTSTLVSGSTVTVSNINRNVSGSTVTISNAGFSVTNSPTVLITSTPAFSLNGAVPAGTHNIGTVTGSTVAISSMPSIAVTLSTVTITNSTFSIVGVSSVNVVNTPSVNIANTPAVTVSGALPAGGNRIGLVSGSTVTVTNAGFAVTNTPTVSVGNAVTVTQGAAQNLKASVLIDGSSNTVQAAQSGAWSAVSSQANPANLRASVSISGSSNTIQSQQSGAWSVSSTPVGTSTITFNGAPQPVMAAQSGTYTVTPGTGTWAISGSVTAAQGPISILGVSGSTTTIGYQMGASSMPVNVLNTVPVAGTFWQATQPVTLSSTSIKIDGSSNTVQLGAAVPAGMNNIGTVTGSSVTIFTSAGGNLPVSIGNTPSVSQSGTRWSMAFSTTTTTAVLSSTGATTSVAISTPIAAVSLQTIRVFRLVISVDSATNITLRDGSTNFGDTFYLTANGSIVLDLTNEPWYITSAGNAFVIKQSGTANVGAHIWYTQS